MTSSTAEHPAVTRFREYLRIKTMQPNPDYEGSTAFLINQANEIGMPYKVVECVKGKPTVIMTFEGSDPSLPTLLLNSHTDVVPVFPEMWTQDAFAANKVNGFIYARGSQDMKCVGMSYLEVLRRYRAEGKKPLQEEVGGVEGMKLLVHHPEFTALNVAFALDEGIASPKDALKVFYGERMPWWIKITATGPTGHGSQFIKETAPSKLLKVIEKFMNLRNEQEKLLEIGLHHDGKRYTLGDVTTINLTFLQAGIQFNVIPMEATCGFDIRVSPFFDMKEFQAKLEGFVASQPGVKMEFVNGHFDNTLTAIDESNIWWTVFSDACKGMNVEYETEIFPAATDSRYLREVGIPALGVSYLKNTPLLLHDHDERMHEDIFLEGIDFYDTLITRLSNVTAAQVEATLIKAVLYEDDATNVLSGPVECSDFELDPGGGKYPVLFLEPMLEYALLVDDGTLDKAFAEEGGRASMLIPKLRESLMLEYAALLIVDDGMFEKTVCAEEGGRASMLIPKPRESFMLEYTVLLIVDDGMLIKVCAEDGPATILLVADDDIAGPE
ncbi:adenylate cyclase [Haplosporangium bisporale]|nr:adenylate cyclase [Haplosporangium bisporale]